MISSRAKILKFPCLLGFDGFVGETFHLVEQRQSPAKYTAFTGLKGFGAKVIAATKKAGDLEEILQTKKMSGHGPTMSFALNTLGAPVNYIGMLGYPEVHPVYSDFSKWMKIYPVEDPGLTQTFEFSDGKLLLTQQGNFNEVSWEIIKKRLGEGTFQKLWNESRFVGMVNWAMLPHLSAIWKRLLIDFMPFRPDARKLIFFDLGDPAKRLDADIHAALKIIGEFQEHHDVILGLNESESQCVARVLRLKKLPRDPNGTASLASAIREKLELHTVVIHPEQYTAASDAQGEAVVAGPYTVKPKIVAGGGDHFNAGLVVGRFLGLGLAHSLQLAVAASGFYVRHAVSPNREQLVRFLQTL